MEKVPKKEKNSQKSNKKRIFLYPKISNCSSAGCNKKIRINKITCFKHRIKGNEWKKDLEDFKNEINEEV